LNGVARVYQNVIADFGIYKRHVNVSQDAFAEVNLGFAAFYAHDKRWNRQTHS
jgi:hypothetical protein